MDKFDSLIALKIEIHVFHIWNLLLFWKFPSSTRFDTKAHNRKIAKFTFNLDTSSVRPLRE
jgi:hypothetical protein